MDCQPRQAPARAGRLEAGVEVCVGFQSRGWTLDHHRLTEAMAVSRFAVWSTVLALSAGLACTGLRLSPPHGDTAGDGATTRGDATPATDTLDGEGAGDSRGVGDPINRCNCRGAPVEPGGCGPCTDFLGYGYDGTACQAVYGCQDSGCLSVLYDTLEICKATCGYEHPAQPGECYPRCRSQHDSCNSYGVIYETGVCGCLSGDYGPFESMEDCRATCESP